MSCLLFLCDLLDRNSTKFYTRLFSRDYPYNSALINGRGRYYYEDGTNNGAYLSTFEVMSGSKYRYAKSGGVLELIISYKNLKRQIRYKCMKC